MLASRLGIAAMVLIGLYGLMALRPFGTGEPASVEAREAIPITDDINLSLEELPTGEPAIQLNSPEGSQTYVLRRLASGEMVITRDDEPGVEEEVPAAPATPQEDTETVNLRNDLDKAREAAMTALADLNQAESALADAELRDGQVELASAEPATTEGPIGDLVASSLENTELIDFASTEAEVARQENTVFEVEKRLALKNEELAGREEVLRTSAPPPAIAARPPEDQFAGKVLMGKSFAGQDLAGMSFKRSVLTGADFTGTNLTGVNFAGAKLQGAYFNGANLIDADLRGVSAQAAKFQYADLRRANLENANFTGTDLTGADLRGAKTLKLTLNGAVHEGAKFDPVRPKPKTTVRKSRPTIFLR